MFSESGISGKSREHLILETGETIIENYLFAFLELTKS